MPIQTYDPISDSVVTLPNFDAYEAWIHRLECEHPEVCLWLKTRELKAQEAIDAAAMRMAREWAKLKGGLPIADSAQLDDLQESDFLRALARAALSS